MPAEVYMNGAILLYTGLAMILAGPIIGFLFEPTFYRLKSFSVYEVRYCMINQLYFKKSTVIECGTK